MKLMEQVRQQTRVQHYAYATEKSYCHWIKRYIYFHGKRHPKELNASQISQLLTHLADFVGIIFMNLHLFGALVKVHISSINDIWSRNKATAY